MWYGIKEYVAFAAIVALITHARIRRYLAAGLAGAVLCSIVNMVHEAWLAGFNVNPGWAPFMFIAGLALALPVCLIVGLPFLFWRQHVRPHPTEMIKHERRGRFNPFRLRYEAPRVRFTVRTLLLLPPAVVLLLIAADPLTAGPSYWRYGDCFEFDVVDARDKHPIEAKVTRIYEGPLAGQPGSGEAYTTLGLPYGKYRGMTSSIGYGGICCVVRHLPRTLIFRRHDRTVTEGVRFTIEAAGYETFEFVPADTAGRPLTFETPLPVFRVELRPEEEPAVPVSWSTRPELQYDRAFLDGRRGKGGTDER